MDKTIIRSDKIGEQYTVATHKSGLKIYIYENREFSGAYSLFGTKYGSVDNAFRIKGEDEYTVVPEGIAHFLEHKLFESEDGDAFTRFSKTGASANAYTSFDHTCYLFSATDNFYESFEILLDFVQHPYFTEETVAKEQGIIGQEISMYDDSPGWIVLFNYLNCIYKNNPVAINIAGTKDTIAKIDAKTLYSCYNTFYNLNNMFIIVSGNVDTDRCLEMCDKMLCDTPPVYFEAKPYNEPSEIVKARAVQNMPVAMPQFIYGIKLDCDGYIPAKQRVETEMLLELVCGHSSALYNRLVAQGLVNKEFAPELFEGRCFASITFSGESRDPERVALEIREEIARLAKSGVDEGDFEAVRKQFYGRYIRSFNNVEDVGDVLCSCALANEGLFDEAEIFENASCEDMNRRLKTDFDFSRAAISVVNPV